MCFVVPENICILLFLPFTVETKFVTLVDIQQVYLQPLKIIPPASLLGW